MDDAADWDEVSALALTLFQLGVEIAAKHGLILVDTKYEFGRDADGRIRIVDEIHTPDSSRYWLANSYANVLRKDKNQKISIKNFCDYGLLSNVILIKMLCCQKRRKN